MRIGLFGQFGSGNLGNDGTLEAAIAMLQRIRPDAELVCICSGPETVERTHGVRTIGIVAHGTDSPLRGFIDRLLLKVPHRLTNLFRPFRHTRALDVMIVAGTGILDDFCETPFGWPYVILRWCLAASWNDVPVYFVSIGAGPVRNRVSRLFMTTAARLASFRSYRDDASRDFIASSGIATGQDPVNCDLAFRLPAPTPKPRAVGAPPSIGVGVMTYKGWTATGEEADAVYAVYVEKMRDLVSWMLARGMQVRLLVGGVADDSAVADILAGLPMKPDNLRAARIDSLRQLMAEIGETDIVVATRYHNVVCALRMGRPTISLGYARKNDELLNRVGLGDYCHDADSFEPSVIKRQVLEILERRHALQLGIRQSVDAFRISLDDQTAVLAQRLDALDSAERDRTALSRIDPGRGLPS